MCSKKLTVNDALDYIVNNDSDFDDLESDSDFDKIDTIGNNSDEVGANIVIDDTEIPNLHENEHPDIPGNDDDPLLAVPVTSENVKEKQPQEYRCRKVDFDITVDIDFKPVTINSNRDIS